MYRLQKNMEMFGSSFARSGNLLVEVLRPFFALTILGLKYVVFARGEFGVGVRCEDSGDMPLMLMRLFCQHAKPRVYLSAGKTI
jgi:hypothetical protein